MIFSLRPPSASLGPAKVQMMFSCKPTTASEKKTAAATTTTTLCSPTRSVVTNAAQRRQATSRHHHLCVLSVQGCLGDGDLLLIRIAPNPDGKFGFNVKVSLSQVKGVFGRVVTVMFLAAPQGGVDQKMPLAVSHVKPDSPVTGLSVFHSVVP